MPTDRRYMTLREAAALLGVSRQRVWQLVTAGVLPAKREKIPIAPGFVYRIRRDVVLRRKREVPR